MPELSSHAPGTFCWPELAATDQKGAVAFYRALFGWDVNDLPLGPAERYSMFQLRGLTNGGRPQGGIMAVRPGMGDMPLAWTPYFAVDDCDATVKKATQLGGHVFMKPTDIPNVGRFAVLADPQGAVFDIIKIARA